MKNEPVKPGDLYQSSKTCEFYLSEVCFVDGEWHYDVLTLSTVIAIYPEDIIMVTGDMIEYHESREPTNVIYIPRVNKKSLCFPTIYESHFKKINV